MIRLLLLAIATRTGLHSSRCIYCDAIAPTRWPWQEWDDPALHINECSPLSPETIARRAAIIAMLGDRLPKGYR